MFQLYNEKFIVVACDPHALKHNYYIFRRKLLPEYYARTDIEYIFNKRNIDNHMGDYTSYIFDVY